MPTLNGIQAEYRGRCDFLLVYIEEAHAVDEWPISSARYNGAHGAVALPQARSTRQRADAARQLVGNLGVHLPVALDGADNAFSAAFSPWPFRFYVLKGRTLVYKAMPRGCTYDVGELRAAIEAHCDDSL